MKVWVFCVFHNEAPMLPYFCRHYTPLAEKVVLFDDHSTDNGAEVAWSFKNVVVQDYPGAGLDDMALVEFASETYKQARGRADWVIWVDADEFIYHPYLLMTLGHYKASGINLARTQGWAMWAEHFPAGDGQIYDEIKTGVPYDHYSKPVVIDPAINITWHAGKHGLLTGHENTKPSPEAELKLLHYRHLGAAYFDGRNARNYGRMSPENIARGLGFQTYADRQAEFGWVAQQMHFQNLQQAVA